MFAPGTPRPKGGVVPRYSLLLPTRYATVALTPPNPVTLLQAGGANTTVNFSTAAFYALRGSQKPSLVMLRHNCARCSPALNPEGAAQATRDEAEWLCADFRARLVDTLLGTAVATFYATILPLFFIEVGVLELRPGPKLAT